MKRPGNLSFTGVIAALVLQSGPLHAEEAAQAVPALPAGWIAGSAKLEKAPLPKPIAWGSHQANHVFSFRSRPVTPAARFDLGALPVVEIAPSPMPKVPPDKLPEGSAADVVVLKKGSSGRVSVQGFEAGFVRVSGALPASFGRASEGGAVDVCGPGKGVLPLAYEAIRRVDKKGTLELVWAAGFLDAVGCRAVILERNAARLQHIAGGVVFAFRTRCPACAADAREVLHVVTPQTSDKFAKTVPFEHRMLALVPGRSGAFEGLSSVQLFYWRGFRLGEWDDFAKRQCKPSDGVFCAKRIRFEVSQGEGESSPTVFLGGHLEP